MKSRPSARVFGTLCLALTTPVIAVGQARAPTPEQQAQAERRYQAELKAPRPIDAATSIWVDELTWMEVRDQLALGTKTVIIPTGGVEQNGPYLTTGKHNVILRGTCEAIARKLGRALCAPIVPFVPEGDFDPPTGHMRYPGTISLREETFRLLLEDIATSFRIGGFTEVILIGDSGGNQQGLAAAAANLNSRWGGAAVARYIPEFYQYDKMVEYMNKDLGVTEPTDEGYHDNYWITALMMAVDPTTVRYQERVKAGKATINGLSIADREKTATLGRKLIAFRAEHTIKAIQAARQARP